MASEFCIHQIELVLEEKLLIKKKKKDRILTKELFPVEKAKINRAKKTQFI